MAQITSATLETILVVDDNPLVLKFLVAFLKSAGFDVLSAGSPEEARRIELGHAGPIHLLISDVIMFQTSGLHLAREFEARRPGMPFILISGHPEMPVQQFTGHFLRKPFLAGELLSTVNRALCGEPSMAASSSTA